MTHAPGPRPDHGGSGVTAGGNIRHERRRRTRAKIGLLGIGLALVLGIGMRMATVDERRRDYA